MLWVLTALLASLGFTAMYLIINHLLQGNDTVKFSAVFSILASAIYLPIFLYFLKVHHPIFDPILIILTLLSGICNSVALLTTAHSINLGEVSTVTPLVKTQPVFTAILGFLLLSESMNTVKVAGIFVVTAGAYIVLLEKDQNLLKPVKSVWRDLSAKLAILTAMIYSLASVVDRVATQQLSPFLYTFFIFLTMSITLTTYYLIKNEKGSQKLIKEFNSGRKAYLAVSLSAVVAYLGVFHSFSLAEASKVVPVLQLQVLITVLGGIIFFDEEGAIKKAVGSLLLIAGVILII